ncbi:MAG: (2Fe-2S) ferredoxin domain-containing protein [Anaerotignaceae bacterium]
MEIQVCIGSVCHLKGSYEIISKLETLLDEKSLTDKVKIKATFCLGDCVNAVCVKFDNSIYSVQPDTVNDFFTSVVEKKVS